MDSLGKFVWHDLCTTDKGKAEKFYTDALGWKSKEVPMSNGAKYTMITHPAGKDIGGYMEEKSSNWLAYIQVANVDESVKAISAKGGKALGDAKDIGTHGRMAVCSDPYGATFALWQPSEKKAEAPAEETKKKRGGRKPKEVAYDDLFTWHEVMVPEGKDSEAVEFYTAVFGWKHTSSKSPDGGTYHMFSAGEGKPHAGLMVKPKDGCLNWTSYIGSDDVEATLTAVKSNGATIVKEASEVPGYGRFGIFTDPTGATLAIFQPAAPEGSGASKKREPAKKAAAGPKKKRAKKNDDDDDYAPGEEDSD
jgi:predicted enzyme related to lactoylglutathione lyase